MTKVEFYRCNAFILTMNSKQEKDQISKNILKLKVFIIRDIYKCKEEYWLYEEWKEKKIGKWLNKLFYTVVIIYVIKK